jgi:GDP-L-fucose synthase
MANFYPLHAYAVMVWVIGNLRFPYMMIIHMNVLCVGENIILVMMLKFIAGKRLMRKNSKIYIAGHTGMVGSAILRALRTQGYENLIFETRAKLDLTRQSMVEQFFDRYKPKYVFLVAAKVGGVMANSTKPADFIYENLAIQTNIIEWAWVFGATKLLFLGTSCVYPKDSLQPMRENCLLTGALEPTNEAYAIAKIAGIKMCQAYNRQYHTNFICVMPPNLYGENDNFNSKDAHVIGALIAKFHEAKINHKKQVELWGTGNPQREFMHVDDLADACLFLMENYNESEIINAGMGTDISILHLAWAIKSVVEYKGDIVWDYSKPDGIKRKLLDNLRVTNLGWKPRIYLRAGLEKTYEWYKENQAKNG